jgi:low temperature requirement protein LtrA
LGARRWWQRPRLRTDEEEQHERKVSWLELFYALVFVVVISELTSYLSGHVSLGGVLGFVLLFVAVWWVWIGGTFYTERFETEDLSYRIFTFLQMLPVAAMAVFAHEGLENASAGFALSYAAARALVTLMWLRGGYHHRAFRPVARRFGVDFFLPVALFTVSAFIPVPWRFVLWGIGLFNDLFTPVVTLGLQSRLPRFSTSRLPERFGLFVIIVLGETIVRVVQGVARTEPLTLVTGLTGALRMALAFGLWWVYFDFVARRSPRLGIWWSFGWNYLRLPLVMGIAAVGAGILNVLAPEGEALSAEVLWLMTGAAAVALVTIGLIELTLRPDPSEPTDLRVSFSLKLGAGLLALVLGLVGGGLSMVALLGALILLVMVQMLYGAYVWFRQPVPGDSSLEREEIPIE